MDRGSALVVPAWFALRGAAKLSAVCEKFRVLIFLYLLWNFINTRGTKRTTQSSRTSSRVRHKVAFVVSSLSQTQ